VNLFRLFDGLPLVQKCFTKDAKPKLYKLTETIFLKQFIRGLEKRLPQTLKNKT
jgi:hypothetical protein|tara:strand:+ start:6157 stop:6318 length:162 start_codon:yes stop_codon:yes gene_type:complete